jgi:alpha-glucosidase (family GH31 glycosyl hydrolase)
MMRELHALDFRVLLWVTPFVDEKASTFRELAAAGALVRRKDGSGASLLKWWGGTAGLVDLTRPAGRDWLRWRLLELQRDVGIDGFKIDGGDAKYQPNPAESEWGEYQGPSGYADRLLGLFEEIAPGLCETRTAWMSQRRQIIWRQGGKDSHWGVDNGLAAMVRLGLHMSLLGYDIFMPDMIPGRVQTMNAADPLPTDELLVRWTEASAFMPVMQFSYFPWNYAPETAVAVRSFSLLHKALEPYLWESVKGRRRAPLLRPLWYDHPGVEEFYSLPDEWQLGSDLVAAPVLAANQVARDVLLPPGKWRDAWTGEKVAGRRILQHPAPCPGIPVFVREGNRKLLKLVSAALAAIPRGSTPPGKTTATYQAGVNRDLNVTG